MEHDVRRDTVGRRTVSPPRAQPLEQRIPARRRLLLRGELDRLRYTPRRLGDERTGSGLPIGRPGDRQPVPRSRQPDVEQAALLLRVRRRAAAPIRHLTVEHPRKEHDVELQPFGAVVRQELHAAARLLHREPLRELGDESPHRRLVAVCFCEFFCQRSEPAEVGLPGALLLRVGSDGRIEAECVCRSLDRVLHRCLGLATQTREDRSCRRPLQERPGPHLIRDARTGERLFVGLRAGVDAHQDRDLLPRDALFVHRAAPIDDPRDLLGLRRERSCERLGTRQPGSPGVPCRSPPGAGPTCSPARGSPASSGSSPRGGRSAPSDIAPGT